MRWAVYNSYLRNFSSALAVESSYARRFRSMGVWAVLLMGVVCVACGSAALGLLRCKRWGYRTALVILTINLASDTTNAVVAHDWRTLIGLPIGGFMIAYLIRQRRVFDR